jgi:hypothetical protein
VKTLGKMIPLGTKSICKGKYLRDDTCLEGSINRTHPSEGQGGEMAQTMYAHMNKWINKIK